MIEDLAFGVIFFSFGFDRSRSMCVFWMMYEFIYVLCEVAIVSYPILVHYMGLCEDDPSCDKTTMRLCL